MATNQSNQILLTQEQIERWHADLPAERRDWLRNVRGLTDEVINEAKLGWDGNFITIPVKDASGAWAFVKRRYPPENYTDDNRYKNAPGSKVSLYGVEFIKNADTVLIAEGELDALILRSHGFIAVSSTGGATTFNHAWTALFGSIPNVYVVFDNDKAGRKGEQKVRTLIPHAKIVHLPEEIGEKGDVTDFFIKLGKSTKDFLELIKTGTVVDAQKNKQKEEKEEKESFYELFTKIYEISFFRDAKKDGYVQIKEDGTCRLLSVESTELSDLYRSLFFEMVGKPVPGNQVKEAMSLLSAQAKLSGELISPALRVAKEGDAYFYDLANAARECVKIDAIGWQVITNPGIPFITTRLTAEQIQPVSGGDVDHLFRFINVKNDDDRLMLKAAMTACFISDIPHPVLIIHGPKGAAKTSAMRLVKTLVDPSEVTSVHLSKDLRDIASNFNGSWLVPFDNVSAIQTEISDALSKVVTGDSYSARKLYSDGDLHVMKYRRCIVINGINNPVKKPDLLDRSMLIEVDRVDDGSRRTEADLQREQKDMLPVILGSLFDLTSRALAVLPNVPKDNLARLADFDLWGRAVSIVLTGSTEAFIRAYAKNMNRQSEEAVGQSPFALILVDLLENLFHIQEQEQIEMTATELHKLIRSPINGPKEWGDEFPKSVNWLSRKLNELSPDLLNFGFRITHRNTGKERLIVIGRTTVSDSLTKTQGDLSKGLSPKDISSLRPSNTVGSSQTSHQGIADDTDDKKTPL